MNKNDSNNQYKGSHMSESCSSHALLWRVLAFALVICLAGGVMAAASRDTALADGAELSAADIYEQNVNSTVGITISAETTSRYGYGYTYQASGSGFIISEDGYILTNYHVIEGYSTVTVATYDGKTYEAKVIGYDQSNDIAVLQIDADGLKPVTLGDSSKMRVGDTVLAIGNPLGELTFSLTKGIVSAMSRNVTVESGTTMNLIQTDCAINSGNSGGALFNMNGEVIGITNAKYSSNGYSNEASIDNIGFAIPINSVKRIVSCIIDNGYIIKPYIGVTISSLSEEQINVLGLDGGAWVREVTEDAPADKAGIKVNDIIVQVDEKEVRSSDDLVAIVSAAEEDQVMRFYLYRQGKEIEVDVTVAVKTESALKNEEEAAAAEEEQAQQTPPQGRNDQRGGSSQDDYYDYYGDDGSGNGNSPYSYGFGDGNSMQDFFNYFFGYGY